MRSYGLNSGVMLFDFDKWRRCVLLCTNRTLNSAPLSTAHGPPTLDVPVAAVDPRKYPAPVLPLGAERANLRARSKWSLNQ